jgi:hypothetical protein
MLTRRVVLRSLAPAVLCDLPAVADFSPRLFELRSYLAQPGQRDALIGMFEDTFLDAYQAGGTRIVGTFRSLDHPDRWVWLRAFPDAASRGARLRNFYDGETWKRNADACNATIYDVGAAWLLRETAPGGFDSVCAAAHGSQASPAVYVVAIRTLPRGAPPGAATLISDHSENSYPRQAVHAENVCVTIGRFESRAAYESAAPDFTGAIDVMVLGPSARSGMR